MRTNGMMVLLLSAVAAAAASPALAQPAKYPDRPIRLVVPFPPGGSVDVNARLLGPKVSQSIGQQVVIDNRAGASGIIGTDLVARAAPDGYTLLINTTPFVTNTLMYKTVPYNVLTDFAPVALLSSAASFVGVHPSVPVHTVRELLQLAKSRPGALNYGSAGVGTNPHIAGELFNYLAKTNIQAIQFKGGGPALVAALSGEVSVSFSAIAGAVGYVQSGRLRALGVTSLKPVAALPGVPPIADVLPGYEFIAWFVVAAPKGTNPQIIAKINEHFQKALAAPDMVKRFEQEGLDIIAGGPADAAKTLKSDLTKYAQVIKERGMRAD